MPYNTYHGPDKPDKGLEGGSCNRTSCQDAPAIWYNYGSHSWYCADCRKDIEFDVINYRAWMLDFYSKCQHPMFETRQGMNHRLNVQAGDLDGGIPNHADHTKRGFEPK